jgi:hypothetical protein
MNEAQTLVTIPSRGISTGRCPGCKRHAALTFHHLIPRKMHRRRRFKTAYNREQLARGIYLCRLCHDGIHQRFDELTLALHYHDARRLLAAPELESHFQWVSRQQENWSGQR